MLVFGLKNKVQHFGLCPLAPWNFCLIAEFERPSLRSGNAVTYTNSWLMDTSQLEIQRFPNWHKPTGSKVASVSYFKQIIHC